MKNLQWRVLLILVVLGLSVAFAYPPKEKISLGLDLKGGMHLVLRVDTSKLSEQEAKDAPDRALEIIRNRIDQFGVKEPLIQRQGKDHIIVQLPGITDRERAIELVGRTAHMEFKLVADDPNLLAKAKEGQLAGGYELLKDEEGEDILIEKETSVSGDTLINAQTRFEESRFGEPVVVLEFNAKGARAFSRVTGENVGRRLAIILDGVAISAPRINEKIPSGQAVITGRFTVDQANDLSIALRAGALPCPIQIEEERTIGPLLGRDSINSGIKATIIGAAFVVVFMLVYYLAAGLLADIALVLNFVIIFGALGIFHATLTLPGIAGIILTLGMAVDANVLIYERIREELKIGKTLRAAIDAGYHKAFSAILDSNVTTLIAAVLLFRFGTGPIRGFAVTLTIGLIASMFTAIFVTRVIFDILTRTSWFKSVHMLKLIGDTKINFIKWRRLWYALSVAIIAAGLVIFFRQGERNYGIDFAGGSVQELRFASPVKIEEIRSALREIGLGGASIQEYSQTNEITIRTAGDVSNQVIKQLRDKFPENKFEVMRVESVGPTVGKVLRGNATLALLFALVGILVYVWFRFRKLSFAVAGIIALFHDVLVTLGFFAFTQKEVNLLLVTALLTIAGYSINDTIVIYDRIRENLRTARKMPLADVINLSVNQTLGRTLLTSFTVLMTTFALFLFGGSVLHDFTFALLVGFISGVYSTVYIASPLVLAWERKK